MATSWKLFYDGGCNLCHASQLKAEIWAKRAGQPLQVEVLQSPEAIQKGYSADMVLEADRVYRGADAWLKLLEIAPWYLRWAAWMAKVPPLRAVMAMGYRVVARYRHKWFGTRTCAIPTSPPRS